MYTNVYASKTRGYDGAQENHQTKKAVVTKVLDLAARI
jgi:hypothetical protein